MLLSVIIVNYNVTHELDNCISSIFQNLSDLEFDIIVVDNNSSDREVEKLTRKYPSAKFHFLEENIGFSNANNYAVERTNAKHILILNPDTELVEDFVKPIICFVESHSNVGVCGPMLLYKDLKYQNSAGNRMGIIYEAAEALFFINLYRKLVKLLNRDKYKLNVPFIVNWMSGACMLMERRVFVQAGGFSSDFFLNYEDLDFCKRVEDLGYRNYYFPYLKCIHLDQTSQKRDYEIFVLSRYLSRLIYAKNHYDYGKRILIRIIHLLGILLRICFVNILYKGQERMQRRSGYLKSLKLYIGLRN